MINQRNLSSLAKVALAAALTLGSQVTHAPSGAPGPGEVIVIGQSASTGTGQEFSVGSAIAGAKAYIEYINAQGGISGRRIQLITLDNSGDPAVDAANIRELIEVRKAVALLNCLSEQECSTAAQAAARYKIPLVGAMTGTAKLARTHNPMVFRVRATVAREAAAIA